MSMEAIILAGGLGTRLRSVVNGVPKPMAPIKGRPFLSYVLKWLYGQGVRRCVLAVGYKYESIREYFGIMYKGMTLVYSVENEPLGTGGAVKKAFGCCEGADAFIVNGDTLFQANLKQLEESYNGILTMFCSYQSDASRYGLIELEGGVVTHLVEKSPGTSGMINGGIYLANRSVFEKYGGKFSMELDVLPQLVRNREVSAIVSNGYFIDIGIPEDFERAGREL